MSSFISLITFDVEKFDGRINFDLWQVQVNDVLIQVGLHKTLKGRPNSGTSKELSGDGGPKEFNGDSSKGFKKSNMRD